MSGPSPAAGSFDEIAVDEPWAGVRRRAFDSTRATVTRYEFDPGAVFPLHRHSQEQITLVEDGTVALTVGGATTSLAAGGWSVIAPDVEHGLRAGPEGARILAIVVPRRAGRDAYDVVPTSGE